MQPTDMQKGGTYIKNISVVFQQEEILTQLEEAIRETEEAALDAADTDSIMTGTSFTGNPDGKITLLN